MKVIIAGSRDISISIEELQKIILESKFSITEVVSGGARGIDKLGEIYAEQFQLDQATFLPNWEKFNKAAGYLRNKEMANYADALIAIWDGNSKGTKHMINLAKEKGLPTYIKIINDDKPT